MVSAGLHMMLKVGIIIAQIQYFIRLDEVLIFFCVSFCTY